MEKPFLLHPSRWMAGNGQFEPELKNPSAHPSESHVCDREYHGGVTPRTLPSVFVKRENMLCSASALLIFFLNPSYLSLNSGSTIYCLCDVCKTI